MRAGKMSMFLKYVVSQLALNSKYGQWFKTGIGSIVLVVLSSALTYSATFKDVGFTLQELPVQEVVASIDSQPEPHFNKQPYVELLDAYKRGEI